MGIPSLRLGLKSPSLPSPPILVSAFPSGSSRGPPRQIQPREAGSVTGRPPKAEPVSGGAAERDRHSRKRAHISSARGTFPSDQ